MSEARTRAFSKALKALAEPTRRGILLLLQERNVCTAGEIAAAFAHISRPAVSRHVRVLREAGLISATPDGRELRYRIDPPALARVQRAWVAEFDALMGTALTQLKTQIEADALQRPVTKRNLGGR